MWVAIAAILFIAWALGFLVFHVAGFFIHVLLVIGVIALVLHFVAGNRGAS
jgi:hypothetical protein